MLKQSIAAVLLSGLLALSPLQRATFFNQNFSSSTPLNPCLVSAWKMDEGSGLTLNDSAGSNTATISGAGAVTWTANAIKTGVTSPAWTGTGDATSATASLTNFNGSTPFSVFFWWKSSTLTNNAGFLGNTTSGPAFTGWVMQEQTGGIGGNQFDVILVNNLGTGNFISVQSFGGPATGTLHYFGFSYDGSKTAAGTIPYYDGTPAPPASAPTDALTGSTASGSPLAIGTGFAGSPNIVGGMGYVAIYNCVVTPTQVATYFARGPQIN